MAKSKKDFTLLLIALFCSSLAHAQKQVPTERKDSIDNGSNIIKMLEIIPTRGRQITPSTY